MTRGGYYSRCRTCNSKQQKEKYWENHTHYLQYARDHRRQVAEGTYIRKPLQTRDELRAYWRQGVAE